MKPQSIRSPRRSLWRFAHLPVGGLAVGLAAFIVFAGKPAPATPTKAPAPPATADTPPKPAAPVELQQTLDRLAAAYREPVGVAVTDVSSGWVASVDGASMYPQQSVSKLWVAVTALDAVDRGTLRLDQGVMLWPEDRSVFFQPIAVHIGPTGYATTIDELLRRALVESDNAANDKLLQQAGGVETVMATLKAKRLDDIRLGADEKRLQAHIAGLAWSPALVEVGAFRTARAQLPDPVRDAAMQAYLDDPLDGITPVAAVTALSAIKRGEVLSQGSTALLLDTMAQARTGPRRLKGGLPADWAIAHKTGTGQDWRGASTGINDIGLLTAPDGKTYAVAVFMRRTAHPVPARLAFMQAVSRAVVANWQAEQAQVATMTPQAALESTGMPSLR